MTKAADIPTNTSPAEPQPVTDFTVRWHPEKGIDGFSAIDGTIMFFTFVRTCCMKANAKDVLDYGAGRGMFWYEDPSEYRKTLRDLRTTGATVTAFDDDSFDVIVSENTFEHIEDADFVAGELKRILRPGGYLCARTPNRLGYLRLLSGMVPNSLHTKVLSRVQPDRKAEDVFPTVYKMNSPSQIKALFPGCEVYHSYTVGEPSYFFGNHLIYAGFKLIHALIPAFLAPAVSFFIRKQG